MALSKVNFSFSFRGSAINKHVVTKACDNPTHEGARVFAKNPVVNRTITWPISVFRHATIRLCQYINKERFVAGIGQEEGIVSFVAAYDSVCSAHYKKFITVISIHSALRPYGIAARTHAHTHNFPFITSLQ